MKVYCVSITFWIAFEWSGKVLKRLGVVGLMYVDQGMELGGSVKMFV